MFNIDGRAVAPQDVVTAAFHFSKDLEISEAIGDQQGQIQMHSLLGACALELHDVEGALTHYRRSWDFSEHAINKFFAGAGLLSCYALSNKNEAFQEVVSTLRPLTDEPIPEMCAQELVGPLSSCPEEMRTAEVQQLLNAAKTAVNSPGN